MSEFGQRLKAIRKDIQLTQAELAEKLMVSVQSVSKWECGNSMPDISQIVPLASVLGVTTDCLTGMLPVVLRGTGQYAFCSSPFPKMPGESKERMKIPLLQIRTIVGGGFRPRKRT